MMNSYVVISLENYMYLFYAERMKTRLQSYSDGMSSFLHLRLVRDSDSGPKYLLKKHFSWMIPDTQNLKQRYKRLHLYLFWFLETKLSKLFLLSF